MSLCENNCTYIEYNSIDKTAKCECPIKIKFPLISEIIIKKDKLLNNFKNIKNKINYKVLKCIKYLFTKKGIIVNAGFFVVIIIIIINIINCILFKIKGYTSLVNIIDYIAEEKNEIKDIKSKDRKLTDIFKNSSIIKGINLSINSNNIKKQSFSNILIATNNNNNNNIQIYSNNKFEKRSSFEEKIKKNNNLLNNYNDFELNVMSYKKALKFDKRNYFEYYCSLLKKKHSLIFTFYTKNDYNSRYIKICILFFTFASNIAINALFFNDKTMHKIYIDEGKFNFIYQIPQILYSSIISNIINIIITFLSLSEKNIIKFKKIKEKTETDKIKIKRNLLCKFIIFFNFDIILLLTFFLYISCFCYVYNNTQIYFFKDISISLGLSFLYPFFYCLIPGIFRLSSLKYNNKKCMYKFSRFIQFI